MKSIVVIAHTTGGEITSAVEQGTERDYEEFKSNFMTNLSDLAYVTFNTDEGCVIIPGPQLLYLEIKAY